DGTFQDCVSAGGSGGTVEIDGAPAFSAGQELLLLGYAEISANGGPGSTGLGETAGDGGRIRFPRSGLAPIGPIDNRVDLVASGGAHVGNQGGRGGAVSLEISAEGSDLDGLYADWV